MPITNATPDNYRLGKGRVYIALRDANGVSDDFRFIGNAPSFSTTPSSDTLTHVSSTGGINVTDRDIQISSDLALAFTTDNIVPENQALFLQGTVDQQTVTSATGRTQSIATPLKGYNYILGAAPGDKNVTVTSATQGGTTGVLGTDYTYNSQSGIFSIPIGSAFTEGSPITVTYNVAATTRNVVNSRANTITCAIMFVSDNPDTGKGAQNEQHFLRYVRLAPDGDYGLIGDDWQSIGFTGTVLQDYDTAGTPLPRHIIIPLVSS